MPRGGQNKLTPEQRLASALRRYHAKVQRRGGNECWPWTGRLTDSGYGEFSDENRRKVRAHRWGYEHLIGPIPPGQNVCHSCDDPPCNNPAHWFLGSHAKNHEDRDRKGRQAAGERHGRARLTASQAEEIRRRYSAGGVRQQDLAKEFGISRSVIGSITRGELWRIT